MNRAPLALASIVVFLGLAAARAAGDDAAAPSSNQVAPAATKLHVQVLGGVKSPGAYVLDSGARLSDALTASGAYGVERLIARTSGPLVVDTDCTLGGANLERVFLIRTAETSRTTGYMIDVTRVQRDHDLRFDPLLRDNDKIYVPDCAPKAKVIATPPTFPKRDP